MAAPAPYTGPSKAEILAGRQAVLGPNCALNYSSAPLLIVRGSGQYLYDESGAEYLDCVNNVAHVGHAHPHVVSALGAQLSALNTNSRFLHPAIVSYASRLTATLPAPLRVVFYVNSGSEANDLALRLARAHTKRRGTVCVDGAYHGHTVSLIDVSPYKYAREGGMAPRGSVRCVPQPDCFSGQFRGDVRDAADAARCAEAYSAYVRDAFAAFAEDERSEAAWKRAVAAREGGGEGGAGSGVGGSDAADLHAGMAWAARNTSDDGLTAGCAAFIMESILSCGGQVRGFIGVVWSTGVGVGWSAGGGVACDRSCGGRCACA